MRRELFQPAPAGEARLLLLIDAFTSTKRSLEGRTKLAKLDFLLRYPAYLDRALSIKAPAELRRPETKVGETIETRMVRYRYGPWDPAYFALLGSLIGRGLITTVPTNTGIAYRTTEAGHELARKLSQTDAWTPVASSVGFLKRHFDLSGTRLKDFIYANFPEVSQASWGEQL